MIKQNLTLTAFIVAVVAATCVAQSTIGVFTGLRLNGNTVSVASGTATVTIPNSTQTLIGTTTICTTGNWCQATITLTDAQIKALPSTGITIVAAPGSGYRTKFLGASFLLDSAAGAYTNINATYADLHLETNGANYIEYGPVNDSTTTPALTDLTSTFGGANQVVFDLVGSPRYNTGYVLGPLAFAKTDQNNQAVLLKADNNGSGAFTGGNAANTLKVWIYYAKEQF